MTGSLGAGNFSRVSRIYSYFALLRPVHWVKNLLIILSLLVWGQAVTKPLALNFMLAFISFCLLSSIVYIINDIRDLEKDRFNERKQKSPLVTGALSVREAAAALAVIAAALLLVLILWLGTFDHGLSIKQRGFLLAILGLYLTLNLLYSFGLKKLPLVDVSIIAAGFLLRFLVGVALIDSINTVWFFLIILVASFYMGLGKRRSEMQNGSSKLYTHDFLDKNMYVCQTLCVIFYTLWCIDPITVSRLDTPHLIWTVPILLLILFKYSYNIERNNGGDPTTVLLNDKALIALCGIFVLSLFILIHYRSFL